MPEKKTTERARRDRRAGKSASTQAGEYVKETMDHIREGKHGARSAKQAIAIGLSKARRAGVKLKAPAKGKASAATRKKAAQDLKAGASGKAKRPSRKRSEATTRALKREGQAAASKTALSRQTKSAARGRSAADRSASAKKAARTRALTKKK
jgi:hypothetical protein